MTTVNVDGAIFWGANWRLLLKPRDNPFPDAPGWYVKRKAWFYGYDNAVAVLSQHDGLSPDDPVYEDIRNPTPRRRVATIQ
jgi:hypothetical protein